MAMAGNTEGILVIYEEEAEDWALYLKSVLKHIIAEDRILLHNLDASPIYPLELQTLCSYGCKLLILSNGLLNCLDLKNRYFLDKILQPPENVVILLCGVENSATLYEILNIDPSSHVITTDQDPEVYLAVITGIIEQGPEDTLPLNLESGLKLDDVPVESAEITDTLERPAVLVLPTRISCESPGEIFFLLRDEVPDDSVAVEFVTENQWVKIQPDFWSQKVRCMKALDFPAGFVNVNVYCDGVIKAVTQIEYYTTAGEIEWLLQKVTDPIAYVCQASKFSPAEKLDSILTLLLKSPVISRDSAEEVPDHQQQLNFHLEELPTLLHCAAKFGLKKLATLLLQCPEAIWACKITNKYGENSECIAKKYGHKEIEEIIKKLSINEDGNENDGQEEEVGAEDDTYVMMMSSESHCNGFQSRPSRGEPPGACWKIQKEAGTENEAEQKEEGGVGKEEGKEGKFTIHPCQLDSKVKNLYASAAKKVPEETPPLPPRTQSPATKQDEICYLSSAWETLKDKMESREPYKDWKEEGEFEKLEQEDPYTCAEIDDGVYDTILANAFKERSKEGKSFIMNRPPAPAPRPVPTKEKSTPYIAQVFQQKATKIHTTNVKQLYAVRKPERVYGDKIMYTTVKPCIPLEQEELVLLQEQVKRGTISVDEALEKFKQWQNHSSRLEATQQEKIRQLRDSIIRKRPEEESMYDKITIVHHPNVSVKGGRDSHGAEGIVYASPFRKQTLL